MFLRLMLLAVILCISLLVATHLWFCKSKTAKRYASLPAYGTTKPLLLSWQHYQQANYAKNVPLVGYFSKISTAFSFMFQREGAFLMWIGLEPYVFIYKAEHIKAIINSRIAEDKSKDYLYIQPIVRTGLATSFSAKHGIRRKLLQPAFHSRILENYVPIFNEHSFSLVNKLKSTENEPWIDIVPPVVACALDILCHTVMGTRVNAQQGSHEALEYVEAMEELTDLTIQRVLRPWFSYDFIFYSTSAGRKFRKFLKSSHDFTRKVIQEKKESLKLNQNDNECNQQSIRRSKSLLDLLMEQHAKDPYFTLDDVQEEVDTFMFAGHDTSTIVISWALYLLGLYPDIQDKVYQEQYSIFGNDKTREVTDEDMKTMLYLESVIKETLRLYPPGLIIARENKKSIEMGSYTVPAGSHIALLICMLHRDPEVFPNPEKFDPERFSSENIAKIDTFSYIPFSIGSRSCIGQKYAMMELKVVLSHVIRNFKVASLDPRDKMEVFMKVTLRCLNPMRLRFSQRP